MPPWGKKSTPHRSIGRPKPSNEPAEEGEDWGVSPRPPPATLQQRETTIREMGEEILGLHQQIARLEGRVAVLDQCIADLRRRLAASNPYSSAPVAAGRRRPLSGLEEEEEEEEEDEDEYAEVLLPPAPRQPTLSELDAVRRGMRERERIGARPDVGSSSRREQGRRR